MRIASVSSVTYSPRVIRQTKPVKRVAMEENAKPQQVSFQGCKWKITQALGDGFLGFIVGGPAGAAVGIAIGLGVGHWLDNEDP